MNNIEEVKFKKLNENATTPTKGSEYAAGYDLYSAGEYTIAPGETVKVGTGLAINSPPYTFGAIFARSGMATKRGLRPANCVGVIDEDYTGEIIVALHNDSDEFQNIHAGDRIAQLIFIPYIPISFVETDELKTFDRGDGGFGSTGTK